MRTIYLFTYNFILYLYKKTFTFWAFIIERMNNESKDYYISTLWLSIVRNANMSLLPNEKQSDSNKDILLRLNNLRNRNIIWLGMGSIKFIVYFYTYFSDAVLTQDNAYFAWLFIICIYISHLLKWTQNTNKIQLHFTTQLMKPALLVCYQLCTIYVCIS